MKLRFLIVLPILFCATSCEDPETELGNMQNLVCINESYSEFRLSLDGVKITDRQIQIGSNPQVKIFKNEQEEKRNNAFYSNTCSFSKQKNEWIVSIKDGVEVQISRFCRGVETVYYPVVEIFGLKEIEDNLIFCREGYFPETMETNGASLHKYYNADGSLLLEKIVDDKYVYNGPIPFKDATYNKCYNFVNFESSDGLNFYPVFEEKNVQDILSYDRSNDNTYVSVSIKSGLNIGSLKISPTYFNLPVTDIPNSAFKNLGNLVKIELPTTIQKIGDEAFKDCVNLREVINSDLNIQFGKHVFENTGLRSFTLNESIDAVPAFFLKNCKKIKEFLWNIDGTTNKYIYENAFDGCSSLLKLPCSEFVKELYGYVFSGTKSLKYIYLNAKVKMYNFALSGCSADGFVKGAETSEFILSKTGYTGKIRYYSETHETWTNPDDFWHYSDEGYPISWGY